MCFPLPFVDRHGRVVDSHQTRMDLTVVDGSDNYCRAQATMIVDLARIVLAGQPTHIDPSWDVWILCFNGGCGGRKGARAASVVVVVVLGVGGSHGVTGVEEDEAGG